MSEYQYYEFVAVDRPLTEGELEEVRSLSTRAEITATTFTNTYDWGDFRGDPQRLMERYYDAHLHLANWGTHRVMLRLPKTQLALGAVDPYCLDELVEAWTTETHLVLNLCNEDEGADWEEGAEDSLAVIAGVRAELAAGDHRALYLAWLSAVGAVETVDDDEDQAVMEPPVPAGLDRLTGPQRALADFLRVDRDLLAVAAEASPPASLIPAALGRSELAPSVKPSGTKSWAWAIWTAFIAFASCLRPTASTTLPVLGWRASPVPGSLRTCTRGQSEARSS